MQPRLPAHHHFHRRSGARPAHAAPPRVPHADRLAAYLARQCLPALDAGDPPGATVTLDYPEPDLRDDVVLLRRWAERDLACVEEAATDPRIPAGTTVPAVFSPDAGREFIHRQRQRVIDGDGLSLAIDVAGRAVGLLWLGVRPQAGVIGLGYWIVPSARRRTYGTRAARLASTWALAHAGMARVEAWVDPGNEPSLRLLASAGFEREGVLRAFLDYGDRRADAVVFSRIAPAG